MVEQGNVSETYLTMCVCNTMLWHRNAQCHKWYQKKSRKCGFWSLNFSFMVNLCPSPTQ